MNIIKNDKDYQELRKMLDCTLYARDEFKHALEIIKTNRGSSTSRAWAFFVVVIMSMNHTANKNNTTQGNWATSKTTRKGFAEIPVGFRDYISNLDFIRDRLKYSYIENRDAIEVIQNWDSEETVFYLDPPYLPETRKMGRGTYNCEMSVKDHVSLLRIIKQCRGLVCLSGYESDLYREALMDWNSEIVDVHETYTKERRQEVIWYNNHMQQYGQNCFDW